MRKNSLIFFSFVFFCTLISRAQLPLLGYTYRFESTTLLLLPRSSESFFKNIIFEGQNGLKIIENRNQSAELPALMNALATANYPAWMCSRKIQEILSDNTFQTLKPFVFFDDELPDNLKSCLKSIQKF